MRKSMLVAAMAVVLTTPQTASAEAIFYGRVTNGLVHQDIDSVSIPGNQQVLMSGHDEWDVQDHGSRLGVRGAEALGNGLTAIFQFEFGVDAENTADIGDTYDSVYAYELRPDISGAPGRLAYVGLTGGFGTLAVGRQWSPYYNSVDKTDIMESGFTNDYFLGIGRVGNAVAYVSPGFNGLSAGVALVVSDEEGMEDTGEDFADWTNLSLDYGNGPLSIGVSWLRENQGEGDLWGLAASYNFGMFTLIGQYEAADADYYGIDDATSWALGGEIYLGSNTIRAVYADFDAGIDGDGNSWIIGADHAFSHRTKVFAEYMESGLNWYDFGRGTTLYDSRYLSVGLRHDF